jgi:K+-sensing histidine kinase KdpD
LNGFVAGLITGILIGAIATLFVLVLVARSSERDADSPKQASHSKLFIAALISLVLCGTCYAFDLEKSALLVLMLSVLLIAKLGGSKQGILVSGIAAVVLAYFLPPNRSLWVSGLDNRLTLALFVLGTLVGSIVVEGNRWLRRWIASSDSDRT